MLVRVSSRLVLSGHHSLQCGLVRGLHSITARRRVFAPRSRFQTGVELPLINSNTGSLRTRQLSMQCRADQTISQTVTIVGGGRVGQALMDMCQGNAKIVKRGEKVEGDSSGPIIVCTRNDALQSVIDATPPDRREDLVFIQNGMLQPWLAERGMEDNTQALVYFAVSKLGEAPVDGKTDVNPEGLTAVNGKHAEAFAEILKAGGLACKVLNKEEFQKCMLEKLIWISAFMLVGARHKVTVGEVETTYRDEVERLIKEMAIAGGLELGVKLDDGVEERLCAYARAVAHFPTAVKEFEWRNGWFHDISKKALSNGERDPMPLHTAWLEEVGAI